MGAIRPIQRLNTPVVMLTFSSSDQVSTYIEIKRIIIMRQRYWLGRAKVRLWHMAH